MLLFSSLSIPSVRRRLRGLSLNVHCGGFNVISCSSASKSSAIIYKTLGPYQGRADPANQETEGKRRTEQQEGFSTLTKD